VLRGSEDAGMFVSTTKNDLEREELEKSHFLRRSEKSIPIDVSINSYNIKSDSSPKKKITTLSCPRRPKHLVFFNSPDASNAAIIKQLQYSH
jgi:hypothetical protein